MTDLYAVFGNPIAHSRSPAIHTAFARQTGQDLRYEARQVALDRFREAVADFAAAGGRGANVTLPFKEQACALADRRSARAEAAGAANTLVFTADGIAADNTDGVGLLRDLTDRLHCPLAGRRLLLAGAGGAARGVLLPLLEARPAALVIANRNATRARALAATFAGHGPVSGCGYPDLAGRFDLVINATSASLADAGIPLRPEHYAEGSLAYDMAYGKGMTPFLATARAAGARIADGLGMLVEQAAASFVLWRGVQPDTAPVYAQLRRDVPAP